MRIDSTKLERLLSLLAARTGGLVNYAALGRELALDDKTIKAHVELLSQLFLLYKPRPWSTNSAPSSVPSFGQPFAPGCGLCDYRIACPVWGR